MQQSVIPPDHITISQRQKHLMGISSGLLLATLVIALIIGIFYFRINYFDLGPTLWLGTFALLYFVAPIPLSLYITRQTSNITEGWKTGGTTGCTGALFTILSAIIYLVVITNTSPGHHFIAPSEIEIVAIFIFLNVIGALISFLGSAIGSALGKISKKIIR